MIKKYLNLTQFVQNRMPKPKMFMKLNVIIYIIYNTDEFKLCFGPPQALLTMST